MLPLGLLSAGEQGKIVAIRGNCAEKADCRIEDMGLRIGKSLEMLSNGGGGPILLRVDESRLALARAMAMKIMVEKVS